MGYWWYVSANTDRERIAPGYVYSPNGSMKPASMTMSNTKAAAEEARISRRLLMPGQRALILRITQHPAIVIINTPAMYPAALTKSGSETCRPGSSGETHPGMFEVREP